MILVWSFLLSFALFIPFVLLAGGAKEEDKRMAARFAILQSRLSTDLSTSAVDDLLKNEHVHRFGMLSPLLERLYLCLGMRNLILQSAVQSSTERVMAGCALCGVCGVVLVLGVSKIVWLALLSGVIASYGPLLFLKLRRKRRLAAMEGALPEVVSLLSRALRAGHSLQAALGIIAEQAPEPARAEFAELFRKQKFGLPLRDALLDLLARVPSEDLRVLVTAMLVQRDTGGNITEILDRTATVIRERLKLQGDIRVHTAQGRMTGWILCVLPVVMLVVMNVLNPGYSKALLEDPLGRKCAIAGGVLLVIGAALIQRIVKGVEV